MKAATRVVARAVPWAPSLVEASVCFDEILSREEILAIEAAIEGVIRDAEVDYPRLQDNVERAARVALAKWREKT